MKHQILRSAAIIIAFVLSSNLSAQDSWILSARDGIDDINNNTVYGMNVFGGKLYAAVGQDSGFVYRSNTGNIHSWTKVFSNPGSHAIEAITSTPVGGGNMYISSNGSFSDSSRVFRSMDGVTWSPFFVSSTSVSQIIPFKGAGLIDSIYIVERNSNGDRILKTYYNSTDYWNAASQWDTVLNFETISPYTGISSNGKHNGKLYIGTSTAQLYSSADGNNWIYNPTVGSGFGNPNNKGITAITSFMGSVYVGTENNIEGGQIWSSSDDGITWTLKYQFSNYNDKVTSLNVADGKLWITARGSSDGIVSKSSDGITFITSDDMSFGNSGNNGTNASVTGFGNNIYWGGEHYYIGGKAFNMGGAQIWRLCSLTPPTVNIGPDQIVCPGTMVSINAGPGASAYYWQNGATTQTTNVSAPGYWSVEYVGINGCSAYDTIFIDALPAPSINITNPLTETPGFPYTVCSGTNTNITATAISNIYTPDPPINKVTNDSIADILPAVNDSIVVSGLTTACACNALMSVTIDSCYHTFAGDMIFRIYAPDGSNIVLSQQHGSGADNSYFGTVFRMNALNWISSATPPFTGLYKPDGNFHDLSGNPNGAWSLNIQDVAGGDEGNLKGWSIRFKTDDTIMTFSWTPATGLTSTNTLNTIASPIVSTTYSLTTTNTIGCSTQSIVNFNVPAISFPQSSDTVCYGSYIKLTLTGCSGTATWYPTTGLSDTVGSTNTVTPLVSTHYYVHDTVSGCPVSDSIYIYANGQMFLTSPALDTICNGDVASLTAFASGGNGPYTYTWDIGGTYFYGQTITQSPLSSTSYTISAADLAGCPAPEEYTNVMVTPSTDIYGHVAYSGGDVSGSNVVLFKYYPVYTHFDTVQVDTTDGSGNYHFASVNHGDYLIKVFPAAVYPTLFPTYYGNHFLWDSALIATHDCGMDDTFNITMAEAADTTGPGFLQGVIQEGNGFGSSIAPGGSDYERQPGDPIPGVDVKLGRNPGGQLVAFTQTDTAGGYSFAGVAYGNYTVYADIPGLGRDSSYTFTVDATNSDYLYLDYYVDSTTVYILPSSPTGISTSAKVKEEGLKVYPNPSSSITSIEYTISNDATVSLGIYDVLGVKVNDITNGKQMSGTYKYSVNNEKNKELASGIYFVTLITNGKTSITRLVITK